MSPDFVHLRVHSEYSLVDSIIPIKGLCAHLQAQKSPALALTDLANLFGMVKFYQSCRSVGIKPIIGAELWVGEPEAYTPLVLLCQNDAGYHQLTQLLSRAFHEAPRREAPIVPMTWLQDKVGDLIALSGAQFGDIGRAILQDDLPLAKLRLAQWQALFADRFYIEIQRIGRSGEDAYIGGVLALSVAHRCPVVATQDVRFFSPSDYEAHEARVCIQQGITLNHPDRRRDYAPAQYLKTAEEMAALFPDIPEALRNSVEIARRCNVTLSVGTPIFPKFPAPPGVEIGDYLRSLATEGLQERLKKLFPDSIVREAKAPAYYARLNFELPVIQSMGFSGYFLIVSDFIRWAKSEDIPVGPGRGSGPGSLVAYVLNITDLDPIAYNLLFERFLNPDRVSLPDFDIDFCMDKRDRVIQYVAELYGRDCVSQIATFGTMAAKAVIRDVGRVLGHPYGFVDKLAKLIPFEIGMTLDKAMAQEVVLAERYAEEEEVQVLFDLAKKLEGLMRNVGKHAAGIVIAPANLSQYMPLYYEEPYGAPVTQLDKDDVETMGLIKFDFLGLRTLTIIHDAVSRVNKLRREAKMPLIDISHIPTDDPAVYAMLKRCETTAVFQLESRGMKDLIRRLQPETFEQMFDLVALFRPGPLQSGMVDDYIERKQGRAEVTYIHPALESVLSATYGVILYQEQVMQIAQVLAGYTLGGADLLRRAMGKKKPEEMAKQREIFTEGAMRNGVSEKDACHIFDLMEKFAGYGFNKSHSAAYALVSYQTAYVKAHYPDAFMAAVLSSEMNHTDKLIDFIQECRHMGITVLAPDINESDYIFQVKEPGCIIYGLGAVKGVGEAALEGILRLRAEKGRFRSLCHFIECLPDKKLNKRALENLIRAGAFDSLGSNRATLLANLENILRYVAQQGTSALDYQNDLFGKALVLEEVPPWTTGQLLEAEREAFGLALTIHPMAIHREFLNLFSYTPLERVRPSGERTILMVGVIASLRTVQTKKGDRMAIIMLDDESAQREVVLFSDLYQQSREFLVKDALLLVYGTVAKDARSGEPRIRATKVLDRVHATASLAHGLLLRLPMHSVNSRAQIQDILKKHQGDRNFPVWIEVRKDNQKLRMRLGAEWDTMPTPTCQAELQALLGPQAVIVLYPKPVPLLSTL